MLHWRDTPKVWNGECVTCQMWNEVPEEYNATQVAGGAGFLGSHLCDRLMEAGEEVICLDNYFTGRKQNIAHWIGNPRFELIRHDVTEPIKLEVDRIWHLACPASPVHYQFNPVKTAKTSFIGTYNMLGLARRVGARLLLASTAIQRCIPNLRANGVA